MPPPRQTISYLSRRFRETGFRVDPRKGQNFLVDLNLLELLVRRAEIGPLDVVLEIGAGAGSLTSLLAPHAAAVVSVELDGHLAQLAREQCANLPNVTLLQQDALRNKNHLDDAVLDAVRAKLAEGPERRFKLAANLPYAVATPILSNLLQAEPTPASMTVTIQRELAERITAVPATKDYSALSVWLQAQCRVEIVRLLPPSVFWPRPKVHSAIVHLAPDPALRDAIPDRPYFHRFVRNVFLHRRKFLRSALASACADELTKADVDAVLADLQLGPTARAEELSVPQMLELCEKVRARRKA